MENVSSSNSHEGLVPKLRFPEFKGEWTSSKLGEIGTFTKGAALSKADISDEGTPFILYGELYTTYGEVTYNVVRKTDKTANEVHYSQIGDVIIPTSGETPEEIATSTCVMCSGVILAGDLNIYRTSVVDGRIVSFIINHVINDKIAKVAQGKSVVHVKADEIAKMTINYPTSQEQDKILTLLELLESRISKQRELIEHLKSYKRGALKVMFPQNGENVPRVRFKGFTDAWEQRKLGEVLTQTVKYVNPKKDNIELWSLTVESGLTKKTDRYNREFLVKKEDKFKEVRSGDIVYNPMNMTLGAIGYNLMPTNVAVSGYYVTMYANENYDSYFINTWMKSDIAILLYKNYATGSLIEKQRVQFSTLSEIPTFFPCLKEQQQIGAYFRNLDNLIAFHQRKVDESEKLKQSLLKSMLI